MNKKGFTLIELLIVMAIMGLLLGFSYSSLQGLGRQDSLKQTATDTLAAVNEARNDSLNSQAQAINTDFVYGYIFVLGQQGNDHEYCIYQWNAVPTSGVSYDPTSPNFSIPKTLSEELASGTITLTPSDLTCPQSSSSLLTSQAAGYTLVDNKVLDNNTGYTYYNYDSSTGNCSAASNPPEFFVFENLSGDLYAFDSTGKYLAGSSSIQICDQYNESNFIYLNNIISGIIQPPYVK